MADGKVDVESLGRFIKNTKSFEKIINSVRILSAGNGKCTAEFKVEEKHLNVFGTLAGAFSASLVDIISVFALMSLDGDVGVSVDISISYLKSAKLGDDILIEANAVNVEEALGFLEVEMKNKWTGELLIKGSHTVCIRKICINNLKF